MNQHFVLSDFENVPLKDIGALKPGECRIKLFIGQGQTKISVELFEALRPFGTDAEVVRIHGSGPNALDFHIAFYVGKLAAAYPGSRFSIISGDTGFDPLIKHLAGQGIHCVRLAKLPPKPKTGGAGASAPSKATKTTAAAPKKAAANRIVVTVDPVRPNGAAVAAVAAVTTAVIAAEANTKSRAAEVVRRLQRMPSSKPTRVATLESSIRSYFKPALSDKQVASVMQSLADSRKIVIDGNKVTYSL